jgi:hypothetical protein
MIIKSVLIKIIIQVFIKNKQVNLFLFLLFEVFPQLRIENEC